MSQDAVVIPATDGSRSLVLLRGCVPTVCDAVQPHLGEPVAAGLADRLAPAFVLVVRVTYPMAAGSLTELYSAWTRSLGVKLAGVADSPPGEPLALKLRRRTPAPARPSPATLSGSARDEERGGCRG
jgi:hypothetical protein